MIDSLTLKELKDIVKDQADMANTSFITDTVLNYWVNAELFELYDVLVSCFPEQFLEIQAVTLAAGSDYIVLPDNFHTLLKVFYVDSAGNKTCLRKFMLDEMDQTCDVDWASSVAAESCRYRLLGNRVYFVPLPGSAQTLQIWYVPRPTRLFADTQRVDINVPVGWEDFVISGCVARCLLKEESDATPFLMRKEAMRKHIVDTSMNRDAGTGERIVDVYHRFESQE